MVLTEPGIRVIIDALKSSRQIYQRMLTWVINKVTKTIQLVGILTLGFFWLHDLVVSLLGMALLVFANDFVTMTLSTDNVKYTRNPNNWNVKNVTLASAGIGVFFILEGWLTILTGRNLFHLNGEGLRTFVLLMLVFTSQFRIYLVRERRHFWDSRPGWHPHLLYGCHCGLFPPWHFWRNHSGTWRLPCAVRAGILRTLHSRRRAAQVLYFRATRALN